MALYNYGRCSGGREQLWPCMAVVAEVEKQLWPYIVMAIVAQVENSYDTI